MLNWLLRYQPAMRLLEELDPAEVLDVGAGAHGLSWYWSGRVAQTDLEFGPIRSEGRVGTFVGVRSSADRLPFADCSFDVALSIDMVEHLPEADRESSLRELFRVARRGVIVAYPVGEVARRVDAFLARAMIVVGPLPPWLREHLAQTQYPSRELLASVLPEGWAVTREEREHNAWLHAALTLTEAIPKVRKLPALVEVWGRRHRLPQPLRVGATYRRYFLAEPGPGA